MPKRLLAIAYINDNPQDSNNPDPLVYPFEIPWDNNIAQRNVHVIESEPGGNGNCSIRIGTPFDKDKEKTGFIQAILTYSPRLPIIGFPIKIVPLEAKFILDEKHEFLLKQHPRYMRKYRQLTRRIPCFHEKMVALTKPQRLAFYPNKSYQLDVNLEIPKEAKAGSVYYLHISQSISNVVTGGYTITIIVK